MKSFNWRHFRRDLKQVLTQAVEDWLAAHTNKSAHAVALYGFYAETDGPIHLPMLGLREHAILPSPDPLASWWEEWSPYEWPEPCQEVALDEQARKTLEHSLTLHACSGDVAHWRDVHVLYIQSINKVLNALRTQLPKHHPRANSPLLTYKFGGDHGWQHAADTLTKKTFGAYFGHVPQDPGPAREEHAARMAFLIEHMDVYTQPFTCEDAESELRALGEAALDGLMGVFDDGKVGWRAAKIVGDIGVAREDVVEALREHAHTQLWYASALGMLGDFDWLSTQPDEVAIHGFSSPYLGLSTRDANVSALDFGPLEAWLDGATASRQDAMQEQLEPGRSHRELRAADVPEAVRALGSPHAVVRWSAATMLGDRATIKAQRPHVLEALLGALSDPHEHVRRMALFSYKECRGSKKALDAALEAAKTTHSQES